MITWRSFYSLLRYVGLVTILFVILIWAGHPATAAAGGETKSADGLTVYLGVLPAELIKGPEPYSSERLMHGGPRHGMHEHHIMVAVFDSTNNARIEDATVTAKVSGLGLSGPQKTLEPMKIADALSYGAYFNLTPDLYTIRVTVQRPGARPVVLDFKYDHRRP
jgi:hypothetical protein